MPEDFPRPLLSFINWIILAHVAAFVFYICGLAKEIFIGTPEKKIKSKQQ